MTGSGRRGTGNSAYRRNRTIVLAASDVCGICGHPGALTTDHIIPAKSWPRDVATGKPLPGMDSVGNLRPAHGTLGPRQPVNYCPVCRRACNQSRGAAAARRPQTRDWFPNGLPRG